MKAFAQQHNCKTAKLVILLLVMLAFSYNITAQNTTTIDNSNGSTNVFRVQEALGNDATYFTVKHHMDSLVENGFLNDTLEDGPAAKFARWDWFWSGRVANTTDPSKNGKFSNYFSLFQNNALLNCTPNPTNIQYNWNLLGPVQYPEQRMGRIDVVKTLPNNPSSKVLYAGAPTGGLWRTNDYTQPNPVWENITDNIGLPFIGVSGLEFDPTDNNTAYIIASYKQWTNFSMGVFKTSNLSDPQPTWTRVLGGTSTSLQFQIQKILTHPINTNELYVLRDLELLQSTDGGATFITLTTLPTLTQLNLPNAKNHTSFDFIFDKNDPSVIYITSQIVVSFDPFVVEGHLWKVVVSPFSVPPTPIQFSEITTLLSSPPTARMHLDNGEQGTYIIYPIDQSFTTYKIDKTINSGATWSNMSNTSWANVFLSIFEVSDENENIIYLEGGNPNDPNRKRKIIKSLDGGANFKEQHGYNTITGGVFTHSDVRGFHMVDPSNDGQSDVFFVGNDGGILFSNSSNGQPGLAHQVNWQNKNGTGLAVTQFFGIGQTQINDDVYAGGAQDNGIYVNRFNNWNITIVGDGYEAFFMKNTPNIAFYMGGSNGKLARYHRNTTTLIPVSGSQISLPNNVFSSCEVSLSDQPLIEVNNNLYTSFHDLYKSTDQGLTWTNISNFTTTNGAFDIPHKFVIEGLAVSYQNQDVIYVGFREPTYNQDLSPLTNSCTQANSANQCSNLCPLSKKFYKTTDGGATWTDLSNNFTNTNQGGLSSTNGLAIRHFGITRMTISPTDDNKVWVAFDGIGNETNLCDGLDRVNMTTDGGLTWTDYSNGLPYLPINDIEYYGGTNDGLFVSTDIGMYYTDADLYPVHGWIKISDGLPAAFITDVDVNLCRGKIRVGTFGRGMWEADLQLPFGSPNQEITTNTTWMTSRDVVSNLLIKPGVTLTINTGAVINVAKGKKIAIEQGARLIVNGATITNLCGEMWAGIEVRGNMIASQFTPGAQGILDVLNGATIENAVYGVYTNEHDANGQFIWGTFGGIVRIKDSFIKNNAAGVTFSPYQNFIPSTGQLVRDLSFIINTEFSWDDTGNMVTLGKLPFSHVGMWDNHGIRLIGNEFRNDAAPTTYDAQSRGRGIVSFDSDYSVVGRCANLNFPCTVFDKNIFNNLTYGIKAENTNPIFSPTIKQAAFINCHRGIYLKNIDFAEIVNTVFDVAPEFFGNSSYGIYLDNCDGYEIEENTFLSTNGNATYGIYTKASGSTANEIYNNQLNDLQIANQTEGINGNTGINPNGLVFRCNQNTNISTADLAITLGRVNEKQGSCGNNLTPANNLFSTATNHIWLGSAMPTMDYFYSAGNALLVPTANFPPSAVNAQNCFGSPFNPTLNCPLRQQVVKTPAVLQAGISNLRTQQQTLTDVIDNGNTAALLAVINSTAPFWQIRNELMAVTPYLSEEVLVAMLNRTPALPDWVMQQVLNANAPLTDHVFLAMLQRQPALPPHMVHQLALASSPLSKNEQLALLAVSPTLPDWVLTPIFIANSPLFDEVLIALMEHTTTIANWSIRNIFVRNTPLSNEVTEVLDNQGYPNWVINNINNSPFVAGDAIAQPQPSSPLLEQFSQISAVTTELQLTENELFRTFLHDTTIIAGTDSVIAYLRKQAINTDAAKRLSCALVGSSRNIEATQVIDSLRQDSSLTSFCDFHAALNTLDQAVPATVSATTNTSIKQTAETIAALPTARREQAGAQVLLQLFDLAAFTETFVPLNSSARENTTPNTAKPKAGTVVLIGQNSDDEYIRVYPNPNSGNFNVTYKIKETQQAYFIFTDITGKELWRKPLQNKEGVLTIKEPIQPGIYLYQIVVNNEVFDSNKIVITQ